MFGKQRVSSQTVGENSLESDFVEHAQEVRERTWMNPEMHTNLLNT